LFILIDQSFGLGPNETPPPGLSGERIDPARVARALLIERLAPTAADFRLRERARGPSARVLAHHDDVLVHEALRDVGASRLEGEVRG
jgi:hypothetical protein